MNRKFETFINKKGEKVAVYHKPIEGQLRYVESKRTALDGREVWQIFDNWENEYVFGTYTTKRRCRANIANFLRRGCYLLKEHLNGGTVEKKGKKKVENGKHLKTYAVDVHCDLAHCYQVKAATRKEAEDMVWEKVRNILAQLTPNTIRDLIAEGFETTDDAEVTCSGEEDENGEIVYF